MLRRRPRPDAHEFHRLPHGRRGRSRKRLHPLALLPHAQRRMVLPARGPPGSRTRRVLPRRTRRFGVGHNACAGHLGAERLRRPGLHEQTLPVAQVLRTARPAGSLRTELHGTLPPHHSGSRRLEGPRRIHPHRLGHLERDALGQRPRSGLQRGQQARSRIRHHPLPDAGQRQPDRDARQPLVRRLVPRRPGLLASLGHRPRLLPLCPYG